MSTPNFPTLSSLFAIKPNAKGFSESIEDPSMQTSMDGGYVVSRPRFTRTPRKSWTIEYLSMSDADKATLDTFWSSTVKGGAMIFNWTNPQNGVTYQVRFSSSGSGGSGGGASGSPLQFKWAGVGSVALWDCSFTLQQA